MHNVILSSAPRITIRSLADPGAKFSNCQTVPPMSALLLNKRRLEYGASPYYIHAFDFGVLC